MLHHPSPNFNDRPQGCPVDVLVYHYTGMETAQAALERLCDPAFEVSAHYCIDETGQTYALVPEEKRAWHAGVSAWQGDSNMNDRSIGIELVNKGYEWGYHPFPEAQIMALITLSQAILQRHPAIIPDRIVGHSDIAPTRKADPGEFFPWQRLAQDHGLGVWPFPHDVNSQGLQAFGYDVSDYDAAHMAWRRRFDPDSFLDQSAKGA